MSLSFKHILQQIIKKCSALYITLFYKQESKDKYIPTHVIYAYRGVEVQLHSLLISAPD